ncbi:GGDEF domain-containing protein [Ciceribacter sp. L1K22]|uniref:GGDEF domain-containing protein n=1 Tax=Ciceribacter sp. L1K22 TaxID=2820275 RepID=UPI001ABE8E62|nr:GGDEF domain-containing protein [Ciceribacter sp. L1K22]MBO3760747.1 GGDEF domain-containing protein [Ciceribacter sp. L1K22]
MPAKSNYILQSVIGREFGSERYCWSVLDDLFSIWPHLLAGAAIALVALQTAIIAEPAYLQWSMAALAIQLVGRFAVGYAYRHRSASSSEALNRWLMVFWLVAGGSGALWGASLGLLLLDASSEATVTILVVGCILVQSASARAYMTPMPALTQAGLLLSTLLMISVAKGHLLMLPLTAIFVAFQLAYVSRLIGLRLSQMKAETEKDGLLGELELANRELSSANERLARHALTDGLTALPNRRHFDRSLPSLLDRANRLGLPFSIILVDVDHFKRFNDTHGHLAGDACLRAVATAMATRVDDSHVLARYGGEEFAVLLPDTDACKAQDVAERLRQAIAGLDLAAATGTATSISASFGVATKPARDAAKDETLLSEADEALYAAKGAGRNCVRHAGDLSRQQPRLEA